MPPPAAASGALTLSRTASLDNDLHIPSGPSPVPAPDDRKGWRRQSIFNGSFSFLGQRQVAAKQRNIPRVRVRPLISGFLAVQMLCALLALWLVYYISAARNVSLLAKDVETENFNRVREHIFDVLESVERINAVNADVFTRGHFGIENRTQVEQFFYSNVEHTEELSLVYYGHRTAEFIGAKRDTTGALLVGGTDPGALNNLTYYVADENGLRTPERASLSLGYNATLRSWYGLVESTGASGWTAPYIFSSSPVMGITYATPHFKGQRLEGVLSIDLYLSGIGVQLATVQDLRESALTFIVDRDGFLIGASEGEITASDGAGGLVRLEARDSQNPQIRDASRRILRRFSTFGEAYDSLGAKNDIEFFNSVSSSAGDLFVGVGAVVEDVPGVEWTMVLTFKRSDLFGEIDRTNAIAAGIAAGIVVVSLVITFVSGSIISRPLLILSEDMRQVSQFVLDDTRSEHKKSNLLEVQKCLDSFANMKLGLKSFSKYVPAEIVRILLSNQMEAQPGMKMTEVTIFFSDIRNFTTISEGLAPDVLVAFLTEYLSCVSKEILRFKGTVYEYLGDAVTAFVGAPTPHPSHPAACCDSALHVQQRLDDLNVVWGARGIPYIYTRIGIHTGSVLVGNFGSNARLKYGIIGDSVNLASRLENLNKRYGTRILISQDTFLRTKDTHLSRFIDRVVVKGRKQVTVMYELLCRRSEAEESHTFLVEQFERVEYLYLEKRFGDCIDVLKTVLAECKDDGPALFWLKRCQEYEKSPPAGEWTGIDVLDSK